MVCSIRCKIQTIYDHEFRTRHQKGADVAIFEIVLHSSCVISIKQEYRVSHNDLCSLILQISRILTIGRVEPRNNWHFFLSNFSQWICHLEPILIKK